MIATLGLSQFILVHGAADQQRRRQRLHLPRADAPADLRDPVAADRHAVRRDADARAGPARRPRLVPAPATGWASRSAPPPTTRTPPGSRASRPRWMATLAWAIAGGIAAFSAILVTPTTAGAGIESLGPDLLLKGLAGAVIARMSSIPIAIAASLGIGVIEQVLLSNPDTRDLVTVVIALIIVVALLRQPALGRSGQEQGPLAPRGRCRRCPRPTAASRSIRWMPRVLRRRRRSLVAVGLAYVVSNETASVLTAGRRLHARRPERRAAHRRRPASSRSGQFAYAGIAAAASVHVVDVAPTTSSSACSCGVIAAALASALVGIPALRLQGSRARGLDARLRAGDLDLAAAPGHLPRRRRRAGEADLVGLPARATPSTTTSSRC